MQTADGGAQPPLVVMTARGPQKPMELLGTGHDTAGSTFLGREWLLNDQAPLWRGDDKGSSGESAQVGLENRFWCCRHPVSSCLHNLSINQQDVEQELCGPFKRASGRLVVACTPRRFWLGGAESAASRAVQLRALSEASGVEIIWGVAPLPGMPPSSAQAHFDAEVAKLVTDLAIGTGGSKSSTDDPDGRIRPGLLGELPLWDDGEETLLHLRVCVEAQRQTGAPLLLSGAVSASAWQILSGEAGAPGPQGPCLWAKSAFFDVTGTNLSVLNALVERGSYIGVCPPSSGADLALVPYPGQRPLRTEEAFFSTLSSELASKRVLIGSGLRFRTDLSAFGGPGLGYAFDLLAAAPTGRPKESYTQALLEFLQYPWKPPAPPEKIEQFIECHWCGKPKKLKDHFSKNGLDYCSPKCISAHRQVDFNPSIRNV